MQFKEVKELTFFVYLSTFVHFLKSKLCKIKASFISFYNFFIFCLKIKTLNFYIPYDYEIYIKLKIE